MRNAKLERAITVHSKARNAERAADNIHRGHSWARTHLPIAELEKDGGGGDYFFRDHADIDEAVAAFISRCRKKGSWGYWRVANPPPEFHQQPFTSETLKLYRDRIKQLHIRLDEIIAADKTKNEATGATAALYSALAAGQLVREAWKALVAAVETDADIIQLLRYTDRLEAKELRLVLANPDAPRTDFLIGHCGEALKAVEKILAARTTRTFSIAAKKKRKKTARRK